MALRLVRKRIAAGGAIREDDAALVDGSLDTVLIKDLHQALANPHGEVEMPAMPDPGEDIHDCIAYWEPAFHLLVYLMGWSNPARGLLWWYDQGKQDMGDVRLRMLKDVWDCDGQLDLLAAWFWRHGFGSAQHVRELAGTVDFSWSPVERLDPGETWWRQFKAHFPMRANEPSPLGNVPYHPGSSNELHLTHTTPSVSAPLNPGTVVASDRDVRTAVVLLDAAQGWYHELHRLGAALPDLGDRSWHTHVVVKPIGWLGVFRRSRETGLWFQGKHSLHMKGQ